VVQQVANNVQLSRALRLLSSSSASSALPLHGESIAFVGAGGKTTAMFQLAREIQSQIVNRQSSIIITATTHLGISQVSQADQHIIAETITDLKELPDTGVTLVTGPLEGERTQPVNKQVLFWLHEFSKRRGFPLLIEADGSRQRPLKAPAAYEPPIPDFVDTVIVVTGLSGLGKPLTEEFVFQAQRFREISNATNGQVVTPEMLIRVLSHPAGGLKNIPPTARRVCLLNQAETPELQSIGGKIANELLVHYDSVLVGSLQQNDFQAFERTAGIVLAAGASTRFGQPKQLRDWKGKPFVRQVAETALQAGLRPVIVVTGFRTAEIASALDSLPVEIIFNDDWAGGQSTSIRNGLASLLNPKPSRPSPLRGEIGSCVFLLADQPQVPVEVLRALMEAHTHKLPAILAPLVLEEKRANPVLFDRVAFPDLLTLTGDVGGRALFANYKVEYLPWHDDALLFDVDTPEDYERLKKLSPPS
jgi:molybdenum cofactor cytidylyltransferase